MSIDGFDFLNGYKCSDVHRFQKLIKLSLKIFELGFHYDQNKLKDKPVLIEVSRNESDKFIHLITYKNHYILIKMLHILLGDHNCN